MTNQMVYDNVKYMIEKLCEKYNIPKPLIEEAHPTDPCDVTDYLQIRLNVPKADYGEWNEINEQFYAFHVFAHYLCDMHSMTKVEECDHIANVIASRFMERGYL